MAGYVPKGFKPEAASYVPKGFKPDAPEVSGWEAAGRGGLQGVTSGFSDEGAGAVQGGLQALANALPKGSLEWAGISNDYEQPASEVYAAGRDDDRRANKAAEDAHGKIYNASELAGGVAQSFVPGLGAMGPAATGALNAFGHAEGSVGEQALQTAGGAVLGKVVDKGLKGVGNALKGARKFVNGKKFTSLAQKFKGLGSKADDAIEAAAQTSKDKAVASETGALGGNTAAVFNQADKYTKILADPKASAAMKQEAQDILDSAQFREALENAYGNSLEAGKSSLKKMLDNKEAIQQALARDPAAEAAERGVKDVFLNDKSKKWYAGEAIRKGVPLATGAIGYMVGDDDTSARNGMLGYGLGAAGSIIAGGRGSKLVNDLRSPEVQRALAKGGKWAAEKVGSFADSLARPAVLEATDDIDEKYRALSEWLARGRHE